jgi:hypothetical protein
MSESAFMDAVEHILSGVPKRGMTKIVSEGYGLREALIQR